MALAGLVVGKLDFGSPSTKLAFVRMQSLDSQFCILTIQSSHAECGQRCARIYEGIVLTKTERCGFSNLQLPSNLTQRHTGQSGLHFTSLMACSFIPPASTERGCRPCLLAWVPACWCRRRALQRVYMLCQPLPLLTSLPPLAIVAVHMLTELPSVAELPSSQSV